MKGSLLLGTALVSSWVLVQACGSSDSKKVSPRFDAGGEGGGAGAGDGGFTPDAPAAGQPGGGTGGSSDNLAGEGPVAAGGEGGTSVTASAGAGGDAATPDVSTCDQAGEACCESAVCGPDLTCAGSKCTCVEQLLGSMVVRADGRLLRVDQAQQTPIKSSVTAQSLDSVTSAWQGHYHGCASRSDGSVWCWASDTSGNNQGQLGQGTTAPSTPSTNAVQVQVDPKGQPGPLFLTGVKQVQQGFTGYLGNVSCAVTDAGGIYCWGVKTDGNLMQTGMNEAYATPIKKDAGNLISDAAQIAGGSRHACYLTKGQEVYCWGANIGGPLGNGSETASLYPVRAGALTGVVKVTAGPDVSCALVGSGADAGRVFCWGSTGAGQVGLGPPAANTDGCINYCKTTPSGVRVDADTYLEDVVDIATGYQTSCAIKSDHTAWCWGTTGGVYAAQVPGTTPVTTAVSVAVASGTPRVLLDDGSLVDVSGAAPMPIAVSCGLLD